MRFWKRKASPVQLRQVSTKQLELETAKEILAEVFHTRSREIDDMIQRRLQEKNRPEMHKDELWPATFSLGE
jgi:ribose 1,5-bisphosphokinase PhnN